MNIDLNSKQSEKLADFFFDIAKGIALGVLGFTISFSSTPPIARFISVSSGIFMIYLCVQIGLFILNDNDK